MDSSYRTILTDFAEETADSIAFKVLGDQTTQGIQARISLAQWGNTTRQARKHPSRVSFGRFGVDSGEVAILGAEERSAKRKQLLLDNALRLGHLPRPRGPC